MEYIIENKHDSSSHNRVDYSHHDKFHESFISEYFYNASDGHLFDITLCALYPLSSVRMTIDPILGTLTFIPSILKYFFLYSSLYVLLMSEYVFCMS